jgi:hypothetical protein
MPEAASLIGFKLDIWSRHFCSPGYAAGMPLSRPSEDKQHARPTIAARSLVSEAGVSVGQHGAPALDDVRALRLTVSSRLLCRP